LLVPGRAKRSADDYNMTKKEVKGWLNKWSSTVFIDWKTGYGKEVPKLTCKVNTVPSKRFSFCIDRITLKFT
jgi:hypothetical protein